MKKTVITAIFIISGTVTGLAQKSADERAALAVPQKMFDLMAAHDPAGIAALFIPDAQIVAITKRDGKVNARAIKAEAFSKNFATKRGEILEDMYKAEAEVDGDIADVWGRYVFYIDGKISHCGVNAFHLVRLDGAWKIAGASSTMDPQGCTSREKKMKPKK